MLTAAACTAAAGTVAAVMRRVVGRGGRRVDLAATGFSALFSSPTTLILTHFRPILRFPHSPAG
jgi:hypothetical protein